MDRTTILFCIFTCFMSKLVLSDQRCGMAPNWLVNGKNPILEGAEKGNVVVMSLVSSKSRKFLLHTLDALNNYGRFYSYVVQQKVKILVINGQGKKLPASLIEYFQHIKIYDDPDNVNLFKKLRGNAWDVLVYDVCGRMQFRYVYPYSWLGFPFLSRAINYATGHYKHVCGYCTPLAELNQVNRQLPAQIPPTLSSSQLPAKVHVDTDENRQPEGTSKKEKVKKSDGTSNVIHNKDAVGTQRGDMPNRVSQTTERVHGVKQTPERAHGVSQTPDRAHRVKKTPDRAHRIKQTPERAHHNPILEHGTRYQSVRKMIKPKTQKPSSDDVHYKKPFFDEIPVDDRPANERNGPSITEKVDEKKTVKITTRKPRVVLDTKAAVTFQKQRRKTQKSRILEARSQIVEKQITPTVTEPNVKGLGAEVEEENRKLHAQIEKVEEIIRPITVPAVKKKRQKVRSWQSKLVLDWWIQTLIPRKK